MAELTKNAFREHLRRRELAPVYVLYGSETRLRDLGARTLADFAFGEGDLQDFNRDEFSLASADVRDALAAAEQLPMMSARRVVLVKDVRISASSAKDTLKEEAESSLAAYLKQPSPTSVVIFVADEFNGNRKLTKLLKATAVTVDFAPLTDRELAERAGAQIRAAGADINSADLQMLVERVGPDAQRLENEVEKLLAAVLPEKVITADLITSLIAYKREMDNFRLTNLLVSGDRKNAMRAMKKMFDDGAEPLAILGTISYNFRKLLIAKDMMERGAPSAEVHRAAGVRPPRDEFLAAARRTDTAKLIDAIERIAAADLAIKTSMGGGGPKGSRMQLEMLACAIVAE